MAPVDPGSTEAGRHAVVPARTTQRRRGDGAAPAPADPATEPPFLDLDALERRAGELLPPDVVDYYAGGAGTETTLREATGAWRAWRLRPRVLRGVATVDLRARLLGTPVSTPIGVAPWAYHAMAHPDGERGTARGAAAAGALMTVSTSASTALAAVAAVAPEAPKWFQLYRLHSPAHTADLARRAGEAGYRALVLTVDLPLLGRRLRDLRHDFALPAAVRPANDPPPGAPAPAAGPPWTFDDITRFGRVSGLPVVVKGVLRGDDAARCVDAGAAAVWVSAHGGRQVDPAVSSAQALPEVVDAVGGRAEVYADGGLRSGADALVALALGARAVFVGRPVIWGLATGGADGVAGVLRALAADLAHTMALCGLPDLAAVGGDTVTRAMR